MKKWKLVYTKQAKKDAKKVSSSGLRSQVEKLLKIIENLKGEVMKVYVKYGLLSHPSILLREAGLKVNKLTEGYITQRY